MGDELSVFDQLPKRNDGTLVTPWDDDWKDYTNIGRVHPRGDDHQIIYEPKWSQDSIAKERVWDFPPAIKTGEFVDPAFVAMFSKWNETTGLVVEPPS